MFKIKNVVLVSAVALALAACNTAAPPAAAPAKVAECVFPGSEKAAPLWVCDGPAEGVAVSATGSHPKTAAGIDFQKTHAATSARVKLATAMKTRVTNMIKQYAETTGVGDKETVDAVYTSATKQITDETLVGSRIMRSAQAPDGTMFVLVGLDEAAAAKATEAVVKSSMNNEKALWQKFQAGKAQDELAADIAKQKLEAAGK